MDAKAALERLAAQVAKLWEAEGGWRAGAHPRADRRLARRRRRERARAEAQVEDSALAGARSPPWRPSAELAQGRQADAQNRLARSQRALDDGERRPGARRLGRSIDPHAAEAEQRSAAAARPRKPRAMRCRPPRPPTPSAALAAGNHRARDALPLPPRTSLAGTGRPRPAPWRSSRAAGLGGDFPPVVLDQIEVDPGYEAGLAAALGDDLSGALSLAAPARVGGSRDRIHRRATWPRASAEPPARHVRAPGGRWRRGLAMIAVRIEDGERLQLARLPPARGWSSKARRPWALGRRHGPRRSEASPAAVRSAQRRRAARRVDRRDRLAGAEAAMSAADAHALAAGALREASAKSIAVRPAPAACRLTEEGALAAARDEVQERHGRRKRQARRAALVAGRDYRPVSRLNGASPRQTLRPRAREQRP